jgi:hypothetical protein
MIKSVVRSLVFLFLLCACGAYLMYLTTGSFPSLRGFSSSAGNGNAVDLRRLSEMPSLNSVDAEKHPETIKKWQDEQGVWHFSNQEEHNQEEQ